MFRVIRAIIALALVGIPPSLAVENEPAVTGTAAQVYAARCAVCHDNPTDRIPGKDILATRHPNDVLRAFAPLGVMQPQGVGLTLPDIRNLAVYLTGKEPVPEKGPDPNANKCTQSPPSPIIDAKSWNGWGRAGNGRFHESPGLTAADIPRLKLKWVFAYGTDMLAGSPTVAGERLFVSSFDGKLFSLNAKTGCTYWVFEAGSSIKTPTTVAPLKAAPSGFAVYLGDEKANFYALDSASGKVIWKTRVEDHAVARLTGGPVLAEGKLYVPVSSLEELAAVNTKYPCCTFRGSVVALDAATGKQIWKTYTIPNEPKPTRKNPEGVQMFGPAGGAVWSSPTIDLKKRRIYVGTGNSYTEVETQYSDAILALDLDTGSHLWVQQVEAGDNYIPGCKTPGENNCPKTKVGPDMDFGAPPVLRKNAEGKDVLIAPQKVGMVWSLDPDERGRLNWRHQAEAGEARMPARSFYGLGADDKRVYVQGHSATDGGLTALDITTGNKLWYTPAPPAKCTWGTSNCNSGQMAPPVVIKGAVFSGSQDGHIRAYNSESGKIIWDFDTGRSFEAVNGVEAKGGSVAYGPTLSNGMLFVNSGRSFSGQPGNALMVFSLDGN